MMADWAAIRTERTEGYVEIELVGGRWDGLVLWVLKGEAGHPLDLVWRGVAYRRNGGWHNRYEASN